MAGITSTNGNFDNLFKADGITPWSVDDLGGGAATPSSIEGSTSYVGNLTIDSQGNTLYWDGVKYAYTKGQVLQRELRQTSVTDTVLVGASVSNASLDAAFTPKSATSTIKFTGYVAAAPKTAGFGDGDTFDTSHELIVNGVAIDTSVLRYSLETGSGDVINDMRFSQTMFALEASWGTGSQNVKMTNYNVSTTSDVRFFRRFILIEEVS